MPKSAIIPGKQLDDNAKVYITIGVMLILMAIAILVFILFHQWKISAV